MREIITLKLNQFSLKIIFIVFQTKHILSRKIWLSFNEEKNQNNISSHINLIFKRTILYKPLNLSKILNTKFKVMLNCLQIFGFIKTKQNQNINYFIWHQVSNLIFDNLNITLENAISKVLNHEFLTSLWIKLKINWIADRQNLLFNYFRFSEITEHSFSSNNSWKLFRWKIEY
jgi:hypothetical protein